MITIAAMLLVYGLCSFGEMKNISRAYFLAAIINAAIYPYFDGLNTEDNRWLLFWIYSYGISESYLKLAWVYHVSGRKHLLLIVPLFFHMINDAANSFHYGVVNDLVIVCEMIYFIQGSKGVYITIFENLRTRSLWNFNNIRGGLWLSKK